MPSALGGLAFSIGDIAQWYVEYPAGRQCNFGRVELKTGIIQGISSNGPLEVPGSSVSLEGTTKDPAALMQVVENDDPDELLLVWYLVPFSRLTKVVQMESDAPGPRSYR
jgi:hypothetical protein